MPTTIHGACHCGAVRIEMRLSVPPDEAPVNACQCSFCRAHGAATVADPAGKVTIRAGDPRDLNRYRFDKGTADFLICNRCGVYVAALLSDGKRAWATVNVQGLMVPEFAGREAKPAVYDGEGARDRVARRKTKWTPAALVFEASAAA